ncbi:hypothetical protein CLIB1423_30S00936 [[Candida] railenensis]|uniref:Uncharacterized protein n=1 Tax=[Candida] railenensis TaxID=45579 RepID=A0A9P0W148_9ASCO|nr:hypothetical protein CLIB1423_30S00936 [[Candida] railenensis]
MKRNNKQEKSNITPVAVNSAPSSVPAPSTAAVAATPAANAAATTGSQKAVKKQIKPILSKAVYTSTAAAVATPASIGYTKITKKHISPKPRKQTTPQLKSQAFASNSAHFTSTIAYPPILSHQPSIITPSTTKESPTNTIQPSATAAPSSTMGSFSNSTIQSFNQLPSPISVVSLEALDLINDYADFEPLTNELSSLLTSTSTEDEEKKKNLAKLSKSSHAIFNVITNSETTPINKQSTINPIRELELSTDSSDYSSNNFSPYRMESLTSVDTNSLYNYQVIPSPLMVQPMDLQTRFDDEYSKLQPDPLFDEHFPMFQFSPESDVF